MPSRSSVLTLDEDLVARLNRRAARHGRSAEDEARSILDSVLATESEADFWQRAAELRASLAGRTYTPSEDLLRESREER